MTTVGRITHSPDFKTPQQPLPESAQRALAKAAASMTAITPVAHVHITGRNATVTFQLDSDILPACQDQATAMGLSLADFLQTAVNDALRNYIGA
jgi:uncharacterized protein (DUF4415 family)